MEKTDAKLKNLNLDILLGNLNIRVVSLVNVTPNPEWYVNEHSHTDYEIHMIPSGKGTIEIERQPLSVKGGEFYITGPYVRHVQKSDENNPMREYCLECELNTVDAVPVRFCSPYREGPQLIRSLSKTYARTFRDPELFRLFEQTFEEDEKRGPGFYLRLQTLIADIFIRLFRVVNDFSCPVPQTSLRKIDVDSLWAGRLENFVKANFKNSITSDDASKVLFMSTRQINRLMEKHFGVSFHRYLLKYRLETAKRLLRTTDLSIESVSDEAGFSSHYYMYQAFRCAGLDPPAKFREKS